MAELAKNVSDHSLNKGKTVSPELDEIEFPKSSFKGILKEFSEAVAEVNDVDPAMCLMSGLAAISGAVGKSYKANNGSKHGGTYLNLYTLISATSSCGKGVIMGNMLKPLHDFEQAIQDEFQTKVPALKAKLAMLQKNKQKILSPKEGSSNSSQDQLIDIQRQIDEISSDERNLHGPKPFFIDNASPEAMGVALQEADGVLFSASSEAGDIFSNMQGKYSNQGNDFILILKGFSGDPTEFRRVGRPNVKIQEPCLSSLWMAQPSVVAKLIRDKEASSQGLTARILYFEGEMILDPETMDEISIDPSIKESWTEKIQEILSIRKDLQHAYEMRFTDDARKYLLEFHNKRRRETHGDLSAYRNELGKSREIAMRLAGLLAIAESEDSKPKEINEDQTRRAVEIVKFCQQKLMNEIKTGRIFSLREFKNQLLTVLQDKENRQETMRELSRSGYRKEDIEEVVGTYIEIFEIIDIKGSRGRSSRILRLRQPTTE